MVLLRQTALHVDLYACLNKIYTFITSSRKTIHLLVLRNAIIIYNNFNAVQSIQMVLFTLCYRYAVMQKCWKLDAAERPSFACLAVIFDRILQEKTVLYLGFHCFSIIIFNRSRYFVIKYKCYKLLYLEASTFLSK